VCEDEQQSTDIAGKTIATDVPDIVTAHLLQSRIAGDGAVLYRRRVTIGQPSNNIMQP
jgi:hypothetical protein